MLQPTSLSDPILGEDHINAQFEMEFGKDYKKIKMEDMFSLRVHILEIFPNLNIVLNGKKKLIVASEYTDINRICFEFQEDYEQRKKELNRCWLFSWCTKNDQPRLLLRMYVSQGFAEFVDVSKTSEKVISGNLIFINK